MNIKYEKARLCHTRDIYQLIRMAAEAGEMLPRAFSDLYECLRDFFVAIDLATDHVVGCCALHIVWEDLAEIRSLAVAPRWRKQGIGRRLVELCLEDAATLMIPRVFALTFVPDFFKRLGFEIIDKSQLPHKVWSDCIKCHRFPDCDELAVARAIPLRTV